MEMILEILLFAGGLLALLKGASMFTDSASKIAKSLGVSEIVIGLTLVAFTTSLPELAVSVLSVFRGVPGIAMGNIVGSNIANVGLVLGMAALLSPIPVQRSELKQGYIMLLITLVAVSFMLSGLTPVIGMLLIAGLIAYVYYLSQEPDFKSSVIEKVIEQTSLPRGLLMCIIGGVGVIIGAELVVRSGTSIASSFGVSEALIGLTMVAVGTSLPELATSVTAAVKRLEGIALGNIVGSNIFNLMMVMGAAALVGNITMATSVIVYSVPMMVLLSAILVIFMKVKNDLDRNDGIALLILYGFFIYMGFFLT
jgi:cation:H+ antiporter